MPPGMKNYRGAGILFIRSSEKESDSLLLGCRRKSGVWSIPGGGSHSNETLLDTALRETTEEFGQIPTDAELVCSLKFPFSVIGFEWETFVYRLQSCRDASHFPDTHARDFAKEFNDVGWFPVNHLPSKTHYLIYPVLMRMRFSGALSAK